MGRDTWIGSVIWEEWESGRVGSGSIWMGSWHAAEAAEFRTLHRSRNNAAISGCRRWHIFPIVVDLCS